MNKQEIIKGLKDIGLTAGATVMVHSSLSSFGHVQGGAITVVRALLDVLGEEGTLVVPAFSNYLLGDEKIWDREHTPSKMGAISETVRLLEGAKRSSHAAHSIAAVGAKADMLCRTPYQTGFGPDSPFKWLVDMNATILLMGVDYNRCTIFHLLEAEVNVPYRFLEARKATVIINGEKNPDGFALEYTRKNDAINDFMPFGRYLEEQGVARAGKIGNSTQRIFKALPMFELGMKKMKEDPGYLLKK